ncbi:hypothetical protein [Thermococcus sp. 21S7]|uniref:hypothetical protein n=1 Tax=Thermococcus sp. 21S7 TaxID=1638221 RepID=UPI00143C769F|nr:hypothetical protein [Thermococcus sp. 21S7]NJE61580.1 hypothetical protein [Thermococcus sp. 21S7]
MPTPYVAASKDCGPPDVLFIKSAAVVGKDDAFVIVGAADYIPPLSMNLTLTGEFVLSYYMNATEMLEDYTSRGLEKLKSPYSYDPDYGAYEGLFANTYLFYINASGVYLVYPRRFSYPFSYPFIQYSEGDRILYEDEDLGYLGLPAPLPSMQRDEGTAYPYQYSFYILNESCIKPAQMLALHPLNPYTGEPVESAMLNGSVYNFNTGFAWVSVSVQNPPWVAFSWNVSEAIIRRGLGYSPEEVEFVTSPLEYCYPDLEKGVSFCRPLTPNLTLAYLGNLQVWAIPEKSGNTCSFHYYVTTVRKENGTYAAQFLYNTTDTRDIPPYSILLLNMTGWTRHEPELLYTGNVGDYRVIKLLRYTSSPEAWNKLNVKLAENFTVFSPVECGKSAINATRAGNTTCLSQNPGKKNSQTVPAVMYASIGLLAGFIGATIWRRR